MCEYVLWVELGRGATAHLRLHLYRSRLGRIRDKVFPVPEMQGPEESRRQQFSQWVDGGQTFPTSEVGFALSKWGVTYPVAVEWCNVVRGPVSWIPELGFPSLLQRKIVQ